MNRFFFGFAIADSMFPPACTLHRLELDPTHAVERLHDAVQARTLISVLNPSHIATIDAMAQRFGLNLPIPEHPPLVALDITDGLMVLSVRGLPRLTDRHQYTAEEIAQAAFRFAWYFVDAPMNAYAGGAL